ncbi:MAG: GNAT family N-acetyltransferase [Actinomycetota bacterium]
MKPGKKVGVDSFDSEVVLRNGQSLCIRPIRPDDRERLKKLIYRLSPLTRYFRFQYAKKYISDEELAYYTEAKLPKRCAYVATRGEGEEERIVAVGSYDAVPDMKSAEVAFVVEESFQGRGVGTVLLEKLAETAGKYRIKRFIGRVLPENTRMLELFDESGFKIAKELSEGVYDISINLEEQEEYAKRQALREHIARTAGVRRLLYPHSVAVVGASRDPESVGGALFRNLLNSSFSGPVFPVNPNTTSVAGVLAYPSVLDVPADIDLAVIVVPAEKVLSVVDQCRKKGVRGLVIISVGFGEAGLKGKERERLLKEKTLAYGMRVVGPNCLGILNSDPNVRLNATFSPIKPPAGNLSICSQSGALGLALLDYAKSINLGIAHFVSIGNRIDISSNDLLEFWEDDGNTGVILLYVESFGNPRKFTRIARRVSRKKPIVAVKAGKSKVGARAASSHTGALAATDVAVDAMFRRAGVIRVNTIEEMFDVSQVLAYQPLPKGPRVGILTNAGGPGVLAADACEGLGLKVPTLSQTTQRKLHGFLPEDAVLSNPVDMVASAQPEAYKQALSIMLEDPDLDAIILIYIPPLITRPEDVATAIREVMSQYSGDKPVLANFMMSAGSTLDLRIDAERYVPSYIFPESAAQALARAYHYSQYRQQEEGHTPKFSDIDGDRTRKMFFASTPISEEGTWLLPEVAASLLREYGIPVIETRIADSAEEAAKQASCLGFPVAIKVRSSTITHKTDIGGIALGLASEEEVKEAFRQMMVRLESAGLWDEIQGVIVQPMVQGAQEVIIGMSQDQVFGPLVMLGLGGIQVELQKDVAFSPHPLTDVDIDRMLKQLKALPLLQGWRGAPLKDIDALKEVLLRFSCLIDDFPEIDEMEINPLMVLDKGHGCMAVDARILVKAIPMP